VKFRATVHKEDFELERLRDRVSALIADRMWDQFSQHRPVAWTGHVRFLPEGMECRGGLIGRNPAVLIPYSQICGCDADFGVFNLWVHGLKKPAAREDVVQHQALFGKLASFGNLEVVDSEPRAATVQALGEFRLSRVSSGDAVVVVEGRK
jgi:hypothetical protein